MAPQELPELDSRPQGRREWSGVLSSLVLPLAFIAVLVVGLLYWQSTRGGRENDRYYGTVTLPAEKNPTGQSPQAAVGRAAPDFLLSGIRETVIHLSDKQRRPAVVSFFTTWCDDCRTQMPLLVEAANSAGDGLTMIAIKDPPARMMDAIRKTQAVPGLKLRKIRMSKLKEEVDILLDIYSESWRDNWGYVDVTGKAARKMADDLRLIADPNIVLIAEMNGEPAGMVIGIPNLYEAIRDFNGFIDPIKALKLFWRLKIRKLETGRLLLFGVKPKFRTRELYGLPFLLLYGLYEGSKKGRYKWCEESWILETNGPMNAMMPYWDAYVYKKYRIYEKAL